MNPLVSFVVPCYKLADMLPECVNSILAQDYHDFEVLIMDNCSPDNTSEVAGSFHDSRIRYIRNDTNIGHIRNFNKGIEMSRGKYVWIVSADDSLRSPEALGKFVQVMEHNPSVGYIFCRAFLLENGVERGIVEWASCGIEDRIWNGRAFLHGLIRANCIVMSSCMVRKECYQQISLFPSYLVHASDWYLWCVFALSYDVAYIAEPMVSFRVHDTSLTRLFDSQGPICAVDELSVPWHVARCADVSGVRSIQKACKSSFCRTAARALTWRSSSKPGVNEAQVESILQRNVQGLAEREAIRAEVQIRVGDGHLRRGEYRLATHSYLLALRYRPWWLEPWMKYLAVRLGLGVLMRQLYIAVRRWNVTNASTQRLAMVIRGLRIRLS